MPAATITIVRINLLLGYDSNSPKTASFEAKARMSNHDLSFSGVMTQDEHDKVNGLCSQIIDRLKKEFKDSLS